MIAERLPPVIGIAGKAGSGKDTLAAFLCANHGYVRYSLADPIKAELNKQFGWVPEYWQDREWKESRRTGGPSPRQLAQWFGAYCRRIDPDWWINQLLHKAQDEGNILRMVIPDIRYDNEARVIRELDGIVLCVDRPDVQPVAAHESEAGISVDFIHSWISNDREPEHMYKLALMELQAWHEAAIGA